MPKAHRIRLSVADGKGSLHSWKDATETALPLNPYFRKFWKRWNMLEFCLCTIFGGRSNRPRSTESSKCQSEHPLLVNPSGVAAPLLADVNFRMTSIEVEGVLEVLRFTTSSTFPTHVDQGSMS